MNKLPPKLPPQIIEAFRRAPRDSLKNLGLYPIGYDGKVLERRMTAL
jgi:hypothetical protein